MLQSLICIHAKAIFGWADFRTSVYNFLKYDCYHPIQSYFRRLSGTTLVPNRKQVEAPIRNRR